jgi:hypothetical protein
MILTLKTRKKETEAGTRSWETDSFLKEHLVGTGGLTPPRITFKIPPLW